jgi:fructose transport system substrate-binding protein
MTRFMRLTLMGGVALGALAAAPVEAQEIGACLITKTDTNPFFVKMKEGATAAAHRAFHVRRKV